MSKAIYKYPLELGGTCASVTLPWQAQILSVMAQRNQIVLYALVDTDKQPIERHFFRVMPTGVDMGDDQTLVFLGTVSFDFGSLVFHVFHAVLETYRVGDDVEYEPSSELQHRERAHKAFDDAVVGLGQMKGRLRFTTELEDGRVFTLGAELDAGPVENLRRGWELLYAFDYTVKRELARELGKDIPDATCT